MFDAADPRLFDPAHLALYLEFAPPFLLRRHRHTVLFALKEYDEDYLPRVSEEKANLLLDTWIDTAGEEAWLRLILDGRSDAFKLLLLGVR